MRKSRYIDGWLPKAEMRVSPLAVICLGGNPVNTNRYPIALFTNTNKSNEFVNENN